MVLKAGVAVLLIVFNISFAHAGSWSCLMSRPVRSGIPIQPGTPASLAVESTQPLLAQLEAPPLLVPHLNGMTVHPPSTGQQLTPEEQLQRNFENELEMHLKSGGTDLSWMQKFGNSPQFNLRKAQEKLEEGLRFPSLIGRLPQSHLDPKFEGLLKDYQASKDKGAFLEAMKNAKLSQEVQTILQLYHNEQVALVKRLFLHELEKFDFRSSIGKVDSNIGSGHFSHIRMLFEKGRLSPFDRVLSADPNAPDKQGASVVRWAANQALNSQSPYARQNLATLCVDLLTQQLRIGMGRIPDDQTIQNLRESINSSSIKKLSLSGPQASEFKSVLDAIHSAVNASPADQQSAFSFLNQLGYQFKAKYPYSVEPEGSERFVVGAGNFNGQW